MSESEQEARLKDALQRERETLPQAVRDRLAASRREAVAMVEEAEARPAASRAAAWLGGLFDVRGLAAAGAVAAAALALWITLSVPEDPALPILSAPEVAVVQDLELLEELEFLAWLEEESQGAG